MNEKNLFQRINSIMSELSYLKKDTNVGYGNNAYNAITHDYVTSKLQPLCVKYGVVIIPNMINSKIERYQITTRKGDLQDRYETQATAKVTLFNIDNPNESIDIQSTAHGFDSQDKSPGKAFSMAVKYCYLKAFMLSTGDNEEERVEEATTVNKYVEAEKIELKKDLAGLLQVAGKYNEASITALNRMGIDQLKDKIKEYSNNG